MWADIAIAVITATGIVVAAWLGFKGAVLGKKAEPYEHKPHGTEAWQHSETRATISRESAETRRLMLHLYDRTEVPWKIAADLAKLRDEEPKS